MSETRLFWMSFCDGDKPKGEQFLGVSIVPVTADDVAAIMPDLMVRFPNYLPGGEWLAAASRLAHERGCNPGGEVQSVVLEGHPLPDGVPLNTLMQKADLQAHGLI